MNNLTDLQNQINQFKMNFGRDPEKIEVTLWQLEKFKLLLNVQGSIGINHFAFNGIPLVVSLPPINLVVM